MEQKVILNDNIKEITITDDRYSLFLEIIDLANKLDKNITYHSLTNLYLIKKMLLENI